MDFLDGLPGGTLVHPFSAVELLHKLSLDIRDNCVSKVFCVSGKGFFDEETAENPT